MHEKPSDYVRTTITVPHSLKRRMERVRTVNWSAVACQAFEAKLSELSKREGERAMPDTPSMDDAFERLRRLKNLPEKSRDPRDFEEGFQWGRRWAMATATPQELGRLETLNEQVAPQWPLLDPRGGKDMMKKIALAVTAAELPPRREIRRGAIPSALREFWPVKVGLPEKPHDCLSFARGFCEGALGFWNEAKDRI
jgi:hypothetical protein